MSNLDISKSLEMAGVDKGDTVMMHADAGVAAQINFHNSDNLQNLINEIIKYFNKGTLVVPTFTYSITENEIFDKNKSPSKVGLFSEKFMFTKGVKRNNHPMFSVGLIGKHTSEYINSNNKDCFGEDTSFDLLMKHNGKIICLGCDFSRVTFVHYVEQKKNVPYRFIKKLKGKILENGKVKNIQTSFYARKLKEKSSCNLDYMKDIAIKKKILYQGSFGRFPIMAITAKNFFDLASNLIDKDPYALVER